MMITPQKIIDYWYSDAVSKQWFASTPELDQEILENYEGLWQQAARGELSDWEATPKGCLALAIILDQFPLNMFRGQAKSFSTEQQAVDVVSRAIAKGFDKELDQSQLSFIYMPLMHSEDLVNQDQSVALFTHSGLESNIRFAEHHREIIRKYGRFPHRNELLSRESTVEELTYLASDEAFTG
jgi:uncharacterized protein (DUF924 family)